MVTQLESATLGASARPRANALANALLGCALGEAPALIPGIALAAGVVVASVLLSDAINSILGFKGLFGTIMVAILMGLVVGNVFSIPATFAPGVSFCLKRLLRLGIIMMGIRLSIFDAARIGAWGVPIVLACIGAGLVLTTYFTRLLRLPDRLGTLMAVGTSICGASAIVAAAPVIHAEEEEVTYAVANITVFGLIAMLVYPYLANVLFAGNVVMAGLFLGTAIHETGQVTGAGLIYDQVLGITAKPTAADVAIVIKLVRNVFIAAVIPVMALVYAHHRAATGGAAEAKVSAWKLFPIFILGFVAMAMLRSAGDAGLRHGGLALGAWSAAEWSRGTALLSNTATYVLAMAMAGVGLGTSLRSLKGLGIKPFYVGLFASLVVGIASVLAVLALGRYVQV